MNNLRRMFGRNLPRVAAALCGALILLPAAAHAAKKPEAAPAAPPPPPAELVRQLGAEAFADREAAEKQLVSAGFAAREAVRGELESRDPEVRLRAGRVWEKIRWLVVPGLDAARLQGLLGPPRDNPEVCRNWDVQLGRHGAALAPLALMMWEEKGQRRNAAQVMWQMLDRLDTRSLSAALAAAATDGGFRAENVRMLLLASFSANETGRKTATALAAILQALWLYDDALNVSARGWLSWQDDAFISRCAAALAAGGRQEAFWSDFDPAQKEKGLYAVTYGEQRDRVTQLYVRLAAKMNAPARVAGKVRLEDPEKSPAADGIISDLVAMRLGGDAVALLENASGPRALYLRSLVRTALGDTAKADADRAAAMKALDEAAKPADSGQAAVYEQAELMFRHNDAGAEALYRRVTAMKPDNSLHDVNAWIKLSKIAETRREYGAAADCLVRAAETVGASKFFFSLPADDGMECSGAAAAELLRRRAAEIRERSK